MKALALSSVFALIVAMGSLIVLLSLFTTGIKPASEWIYCNVYFKLTSFITHASPPEFCKPSEAPEIVEVSETDNKKFSRILLSYIVKCWRSAEIKGLYKDHACYELKLPGNVENVTEKNVSDILIYEDDCTSIENSDYGCGEENQILWRIETEISPSLTEKDLANAINAVTKPEEIPISENAIPDKITTIKTTASLRKYLESDEFVEDLCNNGLSYRSVKIGNGVITFRINEKEYTFDVEDVLSQLEKNGNITRAINNQTLILIRYNGARDAVEVIG